MQSLIMFRSKIFEIPMHQANKTEQAKQGNQCAICHRRDFAAEPGTPDTLIYANDRFLVRHSLETDILGYLLIEARRHILDAASFETQERRNLGEVLHVATTAIRKVVSPEPFRVYSFTLAEAQPHFHMHLIPRSIDFAEKHVARGIMQYPLAPGPDPVAMAEIVKKMQGVFATMSADIS